MQKSQAYTTKYAYFSARAKTLVLVGISFSTECTPLSLHLLKTVVRRASQFRYRTPSNGGRERIKTKTELPNANPHFSCLRTQLSCWYWFYSIFWSWKTANLFAFAKSSTQWFPASSDLQNYRQQLILIDVQLTSRLLCSPTVLMVNNQQMSFPLNLLQSQVCCRVSFVR